MMGEDDQSNRNDQFSWKSEPTPEYTSNSFYFFSRGHLASKLSGNKMWGYGGYLGGKYMRTEFFFLFEMQDIFFMLERAACSKVEIEIHLFRVNTANVVSEGRAVRDGVVATLEAPCLRSSLIC